MRTSQTRKRAISKWKKLQSEKWKSQRGEDATFPMKTDLTIYESRWGCGVQTALKWIIGQNRQRRLNSRPRTGGCSHTIRFSAAPLFCSDGKIQVVSMTTHVMESLKTLLMRFWHADKSEVDYQWIRLSNIFSLSLKLASKDLSSVLWNLCFPRDLFDRWQSL